jgi:hypothetical protein
MDNKNIFNYRKEVYPEDNELWVELYDDLSIGQWERILAKIGDLKDSADARKSMEVALDVLAGSIKDWNFADSNGEKLVVNEDNIKRLPSKLATWLVTLANDFFVNRDSKKKESPSS